MINIQRGSEKFNVSLDTL